MSSRRGKKTSSNGRGKKTSSNGRGEKQRRLRKRRSGWLRSRRPEAALQLRASE